MTETFKRDDPDRREQARPPKQPDGETVADDAPEMTVEYLERLMMDWVNFDDPEKEPIEFEFNNDPTAQITRYLHQQGYRPKCEITDDMLGKIDHAKGLITVNSQNIHRANDSTDIIANIQIRLNGKIKT